MRRARFIILAFPKRSKYDPPWHLPEWQDAIGKVAKQLMRVEDENIMKALAEAAAQAVAVQEETKIFAEMQESICNATLMPKHLTG